MPVISVIVPVYKVEPYLRRCVDSILNQTYTDFELILVDDGSPDNCPAICDEYAAQDSRVHVIHQPNGGVSCARNAGLDAARGDYVTFADSDDWVTENYIQNLMLSDADLVCQTAVSLFEDGRPEIRHHLKAVKVGAETESVIRLLQQGAFNWMSCKRFKSAIIRQNNIRFCTDLDFAEDTIFVVQYAKCCRTVEVQDVANYCYIHYTSRETLSGSYDPRRMEVIKRANCRIAAELSAGNSAREREIFCKRMVSPYTDHIRNYALDGNFTMREEAKYLFSLSRDDDFLLVANSVAKRFLPLDLWRGLTRGSSLYIGVYLFRLKLSEFKRNLLARRGGEKNNDS